MNALNNFSCFDLIEDHPDFIIINKYNGINVHKTKQEKGLLDYISEELNIRVYLCHRLDKETSGLMVLAKTSKSASTLSQLFADKVISKRYIAITCDAPKKKQGKVIGDLVPSRNGNYKLAKSRNNPSHTQFISSNLISKRRAWLLNPITGKTHQLRVVLKSLGSPILGDTRYSKDASDRMYLHCCHLSFNYLSQSYRYDFFLTNNEFHLLKHLEHDFITI